MTGADRIAQISAGLARARAAVAAGAALDLEGLCGTVEAAMAEAATAPLGDRGALAKALAQLIEALDGLAGDLKRQQRAEAQRRAAAAYGPPAGRGESET